MAKCLFVLINDVCEMIFIDFGKERFVCNRIWLKLIGILYILHNLYNCSTFLFKKIKLNKCF